MANWIQKAVSKNPGALRSKAKKAGGMSKTGKIKESFIDKAANSKNKTTARQANLAKTLAKMRKG